MENAAYQLNELIKKEADEILNEKGLLGILKQFGKPHVSGSYSLDLMCWRDLDIYLEAETINETNHFLLGGKIAAAFHPVKMSYRNELISQTKGLPHGLYWGVYLGNERDGAWKIDVWVVDPSACKELLNFCNVIKTKLTPETSRQILEIKSKCWQDSQYRRTYNSSDIYTAVLEKNVTNIEGFKEYLRKLKN